MNKKDLSETDIRSKYITPSLLSSGWDQSQIREEVYFTKGRINVRGTLVSRGKAKRADYVLYVKPNIPIAVVEAKDNNHSVGDGIQQAIDYAETLGVPFAFSSNGDGFLFHNRSGKSDSKETNLPLEKFPSPQELWGRYCIWKELDENETQVVLQDYHSDYSGRIPRYYQITAINAAIEAVAKNEKRILLVMATGTGKTYTAFQIVWRLWESRTKTRILFLADRNILVDQAMANDFRAFKGKMAKLSASAGTIKSAKHESFRTTSSRKLRRIDTSYEIYLSLYQAITGPEEKDKIFKELSRNFFDLVVIDECHRGSASEDSAWREILEYFSSATQIGLTATPKETKYASNISYFGKPTFTYSLKQGISDGFLAPYKVVRVHIDRDVEGYRPEPGTVDREGNPVVERDYTIADYDRTLVIDRRTKLVAKKITQFLWESGDRFQKSIVFCVDQEHAIRLRQALVNENSDLVQKNPRYVMRITGDDAEGQAQLGNFADPEAKHPVLVTTSRLLSTGVDVQTCRLIVLDRNIGSMTEFKQIVGRGTRVHEDSKKFFFTIIDFRGATKHFSDTEFDGEPVVIYEPKKNEPINPPHDSEGLNQPSEDSNSVEHDETVIDIHNQSKSQNKIYIDGVEVNIVAEQVKYLDSSNKLITESLRDYSRKSLRRQFASLDDFLKRWTEVKRKQTVIEEMEANGFPIEAVAKELNYDLDPFDLICDIAFDIKPMTRRERVERVKHINTFHSYGDSARAVLDALLEKYADEGLLDLDDARVLKIPPLNEIGTPVQLIRAFGDKATFQHAIQEIQSALYEEVA